MVAWQNGRGGLAVISEELRYDNWLNICGRVSAYFIFCGKGTAIFAVAVS